MPYVTYNQGFNGRIFLTKQEWLTYRRRKPVRYLRSEHTSLCSMCGKPATKDNPLQHAHLIGFSMGILLLGLTPTFLDSTKNHVSAHRKKCNAAVELILKEAMEFLMELGIGKIPSFLPQDILSLWETTLEEDNRID